MTGRHSTLGLGLLATLLLLLLPSARPTAHELPGDARILTFLKPEGRVVRLLVRVPMGSLVDMQLPTTDGIMLNMERANELFPAVATSWVETHVELYEENTRLPEPRVVAVMASLPSDTSFATYDQALAHVTGSPLPDDGEFVATQTMLDMLFEYPITSDTSRFSIYPKFETLAMQVTTVLQLIRPDGAIRAFEMHGDPGIVRLDPRWLQAASRFVVSGFDHILDGVDHLLFLFCLVIPFRRVRTLISIVTAFTLAHSVTLIASAYGMAPDAGWFPPLVETLIALSIVYMALENIVSPGIRRRWLLTFGFGLVHGFGFSFALRETLQFAGAHLLTSLVSFNIGVELGQLVVLLLLIPVLAVLFKFVVAERLGTVILSALALHTAWHWMLDRSAVLALYPFQLPVFDAAFFAFTVRWMMVLIIAIGLAWLVFGVLLGGRLGGPESEPPRGAESQV